jgi:hypothetical protein
LLHVCRQHRASGRQPSGTGITASAGRYTRLMRMESKRCVNVTGGVYQTRPTAKIRLAGNGKRRPANAARAIRLGDTAGQH